MNRNYFHTQESRKIQLIEPQMGYRDDAWLGNAYYFWIDIYDANKWGVEAKNATGLYEIYSADIDFSDILDTVFNEKHYNFWLESINKVAQKHIDLLNTKPTLKDLNDYLKKEGCWNEVSGIQFQDLPEDRERLKVAPIQYGTRFKYLNYIKRIQLAIFNKTIISNFTLHCKVQITK